VVSLRGNRASTRRRRRRGGHPGPPGGQPDLGVAPC